MHHPIKVVDLELTTPLRSIQNLDGYSYLLGIVRVHKMPVGFVRIPVKSNQCSKNDIVNKILEQLGLPIIKQFLNNAFLLKNHNENLEFRELLSLPAFQFKGPFPGISVAVCTRDRTDHLISCLSSLDALEYPNIEILIIDNSPSTDATKKLVTQKYPHFRYFRETRPGLDWARNRAILESTKEIVSFTDDDVIVDPNWALAIGQTFSEEPDTMALTGLVVPYELESDAQILFENYGGFCRGFNSKWFHIQNNLIVPWQLLSTHLFGTGANMSFRRRVFEIIGHFDPALDVGTITNGAGDLEMFFRVIKGGYILKYEPGAMVRHRHRKDYEGLKKQIYNNGSLYAYFLSTVRSYPEQWRDILRLSIYLLYHWHFKRLVGSYFFPRTFPRELIWAEFKGMFPGLTSYYKADRNVEIFNRKYGPMAIKGKFTSRTNVDRFNGETTVRKIELSNTIEKIIDLEKYSQIRIYVTWKGNPLGHIEVANHGQNLSKTQLYNEIVDHFSTALLEPESCINSEMKRYHALATLKNHYLDLTELSDINSLPYDISVSVIIVAQSGTDALSHCLDSVISQNTSRNVEIIVVTNNLETQDTTSFLQEYPHTKFLNESRTGLSYARNTGILKATGDLIIFIDDDMSAPENWLEKLIAPFSHPDVMVITGNILPLKWKPVSKDLLGRHNNLEYGYKPLEADNTWFEKYRVSPVPTWTLGSVANSAFRSTLFRHSDIGPFTETLGPGTPTGRGEDAYIFYKVLKQVNNIIRYEPDAFVWNNQLQNENLIRDNLFNYCKGQIAYHLTIWLTDYDWRGFYHIVLSTPKQLISRLIKLFLHPNRFSFSVLKIETLGYIAGPWALWKSYQKVKPTNRNY